MKLVVTSFHSVKGGVGRTTLALNSAIQAAVNNLDQPVYLIDVDVCGTSLVDEKELCAPKWNKKVSMETLYSVAPTGFWTPAESKARIDNRTKKDLSVTFVNDWFLFQTPNWDNETDVLLSALCWKLEGAPSNLKVIPHSPMPADVNDIQVLLNDENHGAFMEGRLEYLLSAICEEHPDKTPIVVFDCPQGLYGLGRSVVSLGLRLTKNPKDSLAEDGGMPFALEDADVSWTINFVKGSDPQDARCLERWLVVAGADRNRIQVISNERPHDRTCNEKPSS